MSRIETADGRINSELVVRIDSDEVLNIGDECTVSVKAKNVVFMFVPDKPEVNIVLYLDGNSLQLIEGEYEKPLNVEEEDNQVEFKLRAKNTGDAKVTVVSEYKNHKLTETEFDLTVKA